MADSSSASALRSAAVSATLALPAVLLCLTAFSQVFDVERDGVATVPPSVKGLAAAAAEDVAARRAASNGNGKAAIVYPTDDLDERWGYLWDDHKNYADNARITTGLTFANVRWALVDGVVLGVWEPAGNLAKMAIHAFVDMGYGGSGGGDRNDDDTRKNDGKGGDPRMYRVVNVWVHVVNVVVSSFVMRNLVGAVCRYDDECGNDKGSSSSTESATAFFRRRHRLATDAGLTVGLCLFAIHPLQVQVLGWPSCLPYELAAFFSLLSLACRVSHVVLVRRYDECQNSHDESSVWRGFGFGVDRPIHLLSDRGGKRKRGKGGGGGDGPGSSEALVVTPQKIASIAFYAAAAYCKAPAVVLPAVFLVVDVYLLGNSGDDEPRQRFLPEVDDDDEQQEENDDPNDNANGEKRGGRKKKKPAKGGRAVTAKGKKRSAADGGDGTAPLPLYELLVPPLAFRHFLSRTYPRLLDRTRRSLLDLALYFAAAAVVGMGLLSGTHAATSDEDRLSLVERVVKSAGGLAWYAQKLLVPRDLVAMVEAESFGVTDHLLPVLAVPYVTLAVIADSLSTPARRIVACGYGCAVGLLFPSLGFVQHAQKMLLAADRYMYLPLLTAGPVMAAVGGSCACAAWAPSSTKKKKSVNGAAWPRYLWLASMLLVVASACVGLRTYATRLVPLELYYWRNSQLLWTRNVNLYPHCCTGHANLAKEYMFYGGNLEKALVHSRASLEVDPGSYQNAFNVAETLHMMGRLEEAKEVLTELTARKEANYNARMGQYLLAHVLFKTGEWDEATERMRLAAELGDGRARNQLPKWRAQLANPEQKRAARTKYLQESEAMTPTIGAATADKDSGHLDSQEGKEEAYDMRSMLEKKEKTETATTSKEL